MFTIRLVLIAIFLLIGCAFALSQGEENEVYNVERSITERNELEAWAERESKAAEERAVNRARSSCTAPSKGSSTSATSSPTSAPSTRSPTSAPSTRSPTSAPSGSTSRPATSAPTTRPATSAPTTRPATSAPTTRPPTAPTQKASATQAPTQKATSSPSTSGSTSGSSVGLCDIVSTSQEPLKLLVPLYVYPGSAWDQVATAASKVGVIAIINPNSGPSSSGPDSSYKTYMQKLANAGVEMVGYVYTSYGSRSINDVKADIDTYANKYTGIKGIFFDEAANDASGIAFYTQAYNYVIGKGWKHSILNPGVAPAQGYLSISSNVVIFENYGTEVSKSSYASWVKCAPTAAQKSGWKYKFSGIAHTVSSSSQSGIINTFANQGMGLVYVTDGAGGCCTYNQLTSYMAAQATAVASLN